MKHTEFIDVHSHKLFSTPINTVFETTNNGVHPWSFEPFLPISNGAKYIGEVGLDRLKGPELSLQITRFEKYLEIAEERNLPIIIHSVRANEETIALLKKHNVQKAIIHGFNGNERDALRFQELGAYISFGAMLLRSEKLQRAICALRLDHIFFETDDQIEVSIEEIYQCAADILQVDLNILKTRIIKNAELIFGNQDGWDKLDRKN